VDFHFRLPLVEGGCSLKGGFLDASGESAKGQTAAIVGPAGALRRSRRSSRESSLSARRAKMAARLSGVDEEDIGSDRCGQGSCVSRRGRVLKDADGRARVVSSDKTEDH
jgi:hypothetical protein